MGVGVALEDFAEHAAVLVFHLELSAGLDAGDCSNSHFGEGEIDEAVDESFAEDFASFLTQAESGGSHGDHQFLEIGTGRDLEIDDDVDEAFGGIDDALDLPVGDHVESSLFVSNLGVTNGDGFDDPLGASDLDVVADEVLVFEEHDESGDDIAQGALGGEADAQSDDTCDSEERGRGDVEDLEHHDDGREVEGVAADGVEEGDECEPDLSGFGDLVVESKGVAEEDADDFDDDLRSEEDSDAGDEFLSVDGDELEAVELPDEEAGGGDVDGGLEAFFSEGDEAGEAFPVVGEDRSVELAVEEFGDGSGEATEGHDDQLRAGDDGEELEEMTDRITDLLIEVRGGDAELEQEEFGAVENGSEEDDGFGIAFEEREPVMPEFGVVM